MHSFTSYLRRGFYPCQRLFNIFVRKQVVVDVGGGLLVVGHEKMALYHERFSGSCRKNKNNFNQLSRALVVAACCVLPIPRDRRTPRR